MTKDGFLSVHFSALFQEIESKAVPKIIAAPRFPPWILLLDSGNGVVNLLSTQHPFKLTHEYKVRASRSLTTKFFERACGLFGNLAVPRDRTRTSLATRRHLKCG